MYTETKRTLIIMTVSVLMNLVFFLIAYFLKLPLWLDTTGTIYASIILGFPAGFVVAIINNLLQAFFFYGAESLNFYIVSAVTAMVAGNVMRRGKKGFLGNWFILTASLLALSLSVAVVLTFTANKGVPADYWGSLIYQTLLSKGCVPVWATVLAVSSVKIPDIIVSVVLVLLSLCLTPRALKTDRATVKLHTKETLS